MRSKPPLAGRTSRWDERAPLRESHGSPTLCAEGGKAPFGGAHAPFDRAHTLHGGARSCAPACWQHAWRASNSAYQPKPAPSSFIPSSQHDPY